VSVTLDRRLVSVEISRSLYTSNEIYLVLDAPRAALVVTDHFLTAVRHCGPDHRRPDDDALIDHFLFRTVPGEKTYASGVNRLGHGRTVCWSPTSPELRAIRYERAGRTEMTSFDQALQRLEQAFEEVVRGEPVKTNLLSGGVDSTLLQTFLPPGSPSLSVAIDTPEFEAETERSVRASALTGSQHRIVSLRENDYPEMLKRFIATTGLPPHHMQSVLFGELFRLHEGDKRHLLTAQFADALFGLDSLAHPTALLKRWGWLPLLTRRAGLPAALKPRRLRVAESWASALGERIGSTSGLAARAASYTDFAFAEKVFGTARVRRRLANRLQYVLELCPFLAAAESGADAQLEAAHLLDYYCDDAVSIWRQAAMSQHGFLLCPFTQPKIIRSSLAFGRHVRYCRSGETKPALKALLRRRLPTYDTGLPKLGSGLPVQRFMKSGPLRQSPYLEPPEFFPSPGDLGMESYPPWIAWSILTLSAWRELVPPGSSLPPLAYSRTFR
jgi:asparagine synthase (glutamine-hydrolysing)